MTRHEKGGPKSAIKTNITCDFDSCADYSPERMQTLQRNRDLLSASDLSIFTSEIRLKIVLMLMKMETACVCEIQYALNESRQSLISHHLRAMNRANWLHSERWKRWTFYSLALEKKEAMVALIQGFAH